MLHLCVGGMLMVARWRMREGVWYETWNQMYACSWDESKLYHADVYTKNTLTV